MLVDQDTTTATTTNVSPHDRMHPVPGAPLDDGAPIATGVAPRTALLHARTCIEAALSGHEDWCALHQLEAREAAGDWLDVMESDVLRERLTKALSADPHFLAWQFVDAAIACLDAEARTAVRAAAACEEATPDVGSSSMPQRRDAGSIGDDRQPPISDQPPVSELAQKPVSAPDAAPPTAPLRGLSQRIPTLLPHESRDDPARAQPSPASNGSPGLSDAPGAAAPEATWFDATASGIEEAEVRIVRRPKAPQTLIDARLPPLPLVARGERLPRARRSTALKWADPEPDVAVDFHPVASAMDEAQVTIIPVGLQTEAQSRAERRALGVAPDREAQMRRFLGALSGE